MTPTLSPHPITATAGGTTAGLAASDPFAHAERALEAAGIGFVVVAVSATTAQAAA